MNGGKLNVVVRYIPFKTAGPNGRAKINTAITVRMGETVIATREIGGRYSQADALKEFKRFPTRFNPNHADGISTAMLTAVAA